MSERESSGPPGWASQRDYQLAQRDSIWHGMVFVKRNEQGLLERVDPTMIAVSEVGPATEPSGEAA